jgi:hypothetical protein
MKEENIEIKLKETFQIITGTDNRSTYKRPSYITKVCRVQMQQERMWLNLPWLSWAMRHLKDSSYLLSHYPKMVMYCTATATF